jgi:hypothetical protein
LNDEVEVNWRPMTAVAAALGSGAGACCARCLNEQVDRRRASQHLDAFDAKLTTDFQSECRCVEVRRLLEIVHINVYQDLHGVIHGA